MGQIDLYTLQDTDVGGDPIPPGSTINSVQVKGWMGVTQVGGWFKLVIRTHSVDYFSTQWTPIHTDWTLVDYTWVNNPNTGQPWTLTEADALEAGPELMSKRAGPWTWPTWCSWIR